VVITRGVYDEKNIPKNISDHRNKKTI